MLDSCPLAFRTVASVCDRRILQYRIVSCHRLSPRKTSDGRRPTLQLQIDPANLAGLIDLFATIRFQHEDLHAKDILSQFAMADGKKGGQYFTPKSIVRLIVEMIEPYQSCVYDPAMGSGDFFGLSERFIEEHGGRLGNFSAHCKTSL
ncbi:MAG: N-6 DNA methylase [Verrucomicrobiota bacterium]